MSVIVEIRDRCVICFCTLKHFHPPVRTALSMGTTNSPSTDDVFIDAIWATCYECGCIQLTTLVDPKLLYSNSHNPGTVGLTWNKHHTEFSKFVMSEWKGTDIAEIGASTLHLYKLLSAHKSLNYTVIDPSMKPTSEVTVIPELFTNVDVYNKKFSTIIHSHTVEHFYDPISDLISMKYMLVTGGKIIMSVPLTHVQLEHHHLNALNLEHTYSINLNILLHMLDDAGLSAIKIERFNDYCVFVSAVRKSSTGTYESHIKNIKSTVKQINDYGKPIYMFGAHVFSQTLINAGVTCPIIAVLDDDVHKIGHRLYGTDVMVQSPTILANVIHPVVLVRAAQYTNEIVGRINDINPTTTFI